MGCLIKRNSDNKVVDVSVEITRSIPVENSEEFTQEVTNKTSQLYRKLASVPFLSTEEALSVYKNIFSKKFLSIFGNWTQIESKELVLNLNKNESVKKEVDDEFITLTSSKGKANLSEVMTDFEFEGVLSEEEIEDLLLDDMVFKLEGIEIQKSERGKGHAKYLMNKVMQEFRESPLDDMVLNASPMGTTGLNVQSLVSFYKKFGFKVIKNQGGNVMMLLNKSDILNPLLVENKFIGDDNPLVYSTGEPKLFFMTPQGVITTNYETALKNTNTGVIKSGFLATDDLLVTKDKDIFQVANNDVVFYNNEYRLNNNQSFTSLFDIDSNSNPNSLNGFINKSIRDGILGAQKIKVGQDYFFKGQGELDSLSIYNSQLVLSSSITNLGRDSIKTFPDGTIAFTEINSDSIELTGSNGAEILSKKDLKQQLKDGKFPSLNRRYDGFLDTTYTLFREDNDLYKESQVVAETNTTEKNLRISLLNTLNKLGIKTLSISNYIDNYNTRVNVDPSVEALADISKNIIAFAEGKDTLENLTEETSHFIIEGFQDQDSIEKVLPLVENTIEWKENSARYYEKYSELYSGNELDNIVRREVLGKVLKSKIIDNFNSQNESPNAVGVISYLRDRFASFLNSIRSYFTPTLRKELDTVTDTLASKVLDEEIHNYFDADLIKNSKFILFSINNKREIVTLQRARQKLEKRLNELKQSKDVTAPKAQQDINRLNEAINQNDEWHAIKVITSSLDPQVNSIKRQLASYKKLNEKGGDKVAYFTPEEQNAFNSLTEDFLPILGELRVLVDKELEPIAEVNRESLLAQIDTLINEVVQLKGEKDLQVKSDNNSIANRIIQQYNLSENERENLERLIQRDLSETSWFQRNFGSLEHSSNAFLGMLGKIINENNNKANNSLIRDINPFLKSIDSGDWNLSKLQTLIEKNGNELTNYTKSPYQWAKFEQSEREAQVNAYNLTFEANLTVEQYFDNLKNGKIKRRAEFTQEQLKTFNDSMNLWYENNTERRYLQEFYDKKEKMYNDLDTSQDTKDFLQALSVRRYSIMSKYISPTNDLDYTEITTRDLQQLALLTQERKAAKSIIDAESGLEKTGSRLQLAQDLKNLDASYQENKRDFSIKDSFFDTLEKVEKTEGNRLAYDWLMVNGGIIFNDNFWDGFGKDRVTLIEKLESVKNEIREESLEDFDRVDIIQSRLELLLKRKTEILKQYQVANNPSEIDYDNMSGQVLTNIKDIETELQTLFRDVNGVLSRYDEEEVTDTISTENTVNEAYKKALKDSNVNEIDFLEDHLTETDKSNMQEVKRRIEKIKEGSEFVDNLTRRFLERFYGQESMTIEDIQEAISNSDSIELATAYGKTRVLPYFKRFAPQGYDNFISSLKDGSKSVTEFVTEVRNRKEGAPVKSITDLLSVNTQFSWTEDEAGANLLNPNYDENFEGGFRQPKIDTYLNDEFFNEYGVSKEEFISTKDITPTTNLDSYNMLEQLWDIKRKGLDAYNESGNNNVYKIPQVSKGTVEKSKDFISKNPAQTVGNSIKDIIYNRVDDLGYGERVEGEDVRDISDVRLIPKYYLRDLEESTDVSTELAHSYSQFLQSAYVYKERLNTVSDAMVLQQTLLERAEANNLDENKSGYNMFKNFMDANFFGITRSRKFTVSLPNGKQLDLSKMAMMFDKFVRYVNIGFSLPIAATSLVSAEVFLRIENFVGEHTNRNSAKWATKEFANLTKDYVTEIGSINKTSRMNSLAERFRVFDLTDRTTSSGFSKIIRASNHLPYKFSEIANFPIAPRIMLTVLDDFRLIGDSFMDFNTYKQRSDNQGLSTKELNEKWNANRENSMYNLLEDNDGVVDFSQELKDKLGEDKLEEQLSRVQGRISRVNANVDSVVPQEDKSAATRDFLMNFMTAHRGWLSIAIQRKFKKQHFNFNTGQTEEGHYRTLAKYLKDSFGLMEEKNMKNFVKVFKENFNTLEDFEKRNLKRIMTELGVYMFLLGFGMIVAGIADDDDNKDIWAIQFSSYIYFRTVSEVGSVQAPTGAFGLVDTVQAPFIAINSIKEIMDVKGWSFEEVNSGAYEGHSKLYKKLVKQSWLRHLYDLKGVKQKSDYYRLLNSETLFHLSK